MRQRNQQISEIQVLAQARAIAVFGSNGQLEGNQLLSNHLLSNKCAYCASLCAKYCICALLLVSVVPSWALAQGSIFGNVEKADLSIPVNGSVSFFGFINGSDAEIRTDISIGAGYDNGNWFDDFQNYLAESPGALYAYYFLHATSNEGVQLSGMIPNNSFQQENITLTPVLWPSQPTGLTVTNVSVSQVNLRWDYDSSLTYHIYRRAQTAAGSFFRIDNPSGALSDQGIADSVYIDTAVDGSTEFDYLIIGENAAGVYSSRSEISVFGSSGCCQTAGDANKDGKSNIADITFLISFIFTGGSAPECRDQADANGDNKVNIADVTYLVSWIFTGGSWPECGTTGSINPSATFNTNGSFTGSL